MKSHPNSEAWKKADEELKRIDETKKERTPSDRHEQRMQALYVEPTSETVWNRPADMSAPTAHDFNADAVNEYAGRYYQGYTTPADMQKDCDPELRDALEKWSGRPVLHPPEWPQMPD